MGTGGGVRELGTWLGKLGMLSLLWLVVASLDVVTAERGMAAQMKNNVEEYTLPLENCDFRFKGHNSVPPIFNLQNPSLNALSSNIIARNGKVLRTGVTADHCLFPATDGEEVAGSLEGGEKSQAVEEMAAICAKHFHMELDRLATTALANLTEWFTKSLKGRHVVLPLTAVDFADGTKLRANDGNKQFPEPRRCISFFTTSDIITVLEKVLNKAHRKKLSKINMRATRFRYDFNSLLTSILQFPQTKTVAFVLLSLSAREVNSWDRA